MQDQPIIVCYPFVAADKIGGSHISALKLIQALDRSRVRPMVALHGPKGDFAAFLERQNVDFVIAPDVEILAPTGPRERGKGRLAAAWTYLTDSVPRMRRFLRINGVEIVHTNDGRMHASWAFAARAAGAKLLWHHRGDPLARGANVMAPVLANHIITVSRFARPRRPILPIGHKWSVVHSPFDHPTAPPDRAQARAALVGELGCPPETRFLGYFGALVDRKRPVAFVEAVHAFIRRYPDIPVAGLLFGEARPGGQQVETVVRDRAAELGVADRIHLMGFRHPSEPYMCATDILLVPAVNEPFGRTLIEAMLLGTPVVATDHGGNPEAIVHGRTGFLVEADNPEAFVSPVHRLLSDPECWDRISAAAKDRALTSYSLAKHVELISNIYEKLARRPGSHA